MCYNNCPRTGFSDPDVEQAVFGRSRTSDETYLGVYKGIYSGRAKDEAILSRCQDGGVVTSLLVNLLKTDLTARAIVSVTEQGSWHPVPRVATSRDEVLAAAGSKYTPSPSVEGLRSAVWEYRRGQSWLGKVAVTGTACQMRALRKMQTSGYAPTRLLQSEQLSIGLFCFETFDYKSLKTHLESRGVDLSKVTRMEIKKGRFRVFQHSELVYDVTISKLEEIVRPCCRSCTDFTSEFSDISLGNVGSPDGWSTIIVRTDRGQQALDGVTAEGLVEVKPVAEVKPGISETIRLAKMKRERVQKVGEKAKP